MGVVVALGALFVSVTDSPGPIHHRKNGMFVCICSIFIASLLTGFATINPVILAIFLGLACLFYSMINVYGARAGGIGTSSLIVVTLSLDPHLNLDTTAKVLQHSLLITAGGMWYMCYSLVLYKFRPYRLPQQALGDCIQATAEYLKLRANLYKRNTDYDSLFRQLLQQQAIVQHKQVELNELLFKSRSIVKESTNVGRTLVMIHLDVADIFEKIMMSHQTKLTFLMIIMPWQVSWLMNWMKWASQLKAGLHPQQIIEYRSTWKKRMRSSTACEKLI
jgi:hypothetical protein